MMSRQDKWWRRVVPFGENPGTGRVAILASWRGQASIGDAPGSRDSVFSWQLARRDPE